MMPSSCSLSMESFKRFPLYLYSDYVDQENETYSMVTNLTLGFNEERVKATGFGFFVSSLKNLQNGQGVMLVKGHSVVSGLGSTQQAYQYDGTKFCYFRNVTSSNYTILYDKVDNTCSKKNRPHVGFGLASIGENFKMLVDGMTKHVMAFNYHDGLGWLSSAQRIHSQCAFSQ